MKFPNLFLPFLTLIFGGEVSVVSAATPLPAWYGQPNTTRQAYTFGTNSLTPPTSLLENSYGTPVATITLGAFSDGWQNPANPIQLSGVLSEGAWDFGSAGKISIQVPVIPTPISPGDIYRVDFQIYAVGYRNPTVLPGLDIPGFTPSGLTLDQGTVTMDPIFPGSSWDFRTWTGELNNVTSGTITFNLTSPAGNTAVVDTYEVFTRYTLIPEPTGACLLLLPFLSLISRRRRTPPG